MAIPLEIFQNLLMGIRPVAKVAQRYHSTGLNADSQTANQVFELYSKFVAVEGKDVLEIGPGQTLEVLERAIASGANSCTAVDVADYIAPERACGKGVSYIVYDGKRLPFESHRFDVIWAYTAFEHLRYPAVTVAECFRVLRNGGRLVSLIDLGDHSYYGLNEAEPLKLFHCLRYPEWLWNLMRWNRSSYVNRLRKSDWKNLLREAGFVLCHEESRISEEIARALPALEYLHRYSYEDAVTNVITVCLEKPKASPGRANR
ncbi:MAG TPA: class I SAM-dependent methyltransferase [Nitrospira sp.]|nr:class I SAM-dependent methyltransferase [Nitrospira sp.]